MIQPLKSSRVTWALDWLEIDDPGIAVNGFLMPVCLIVVAEKNPEPLHHEIHAELEQRHAERFLARAFAEHGTPDVVVMRDLPEWDPPAWDNFARDFACKVRLIDAEEESV